MRRMLFASLIGLLPFLAASGGIPAAQDFTVEKLSPVPIERLNRMARERANAAARTELTTLSEVPTAFETLEPADSGRVPNYLRALTPAARVAPFARLLKTVLYSGAIRPEIKMAMGLRTAQLNGSPYVAAHLQRFL